MTSMVMACAVMLAVGASLAMIRVERGPSILDRAVALDIITKIPMIGVALEAALNRRTDTVPVLAALALVGFVASVTIARFASVEPEDAGRIKTLEEIETRRRRPSRKRRDCGPTGSTVRRDQKTGQEQAMNWSTVLDVLAGICFVAGSFLTLAAGVGVLRFPDLLARMHAGAKPQVLGVLLALTGLALRIRIGPVVWTLALVAVFQLFTAPVAAHLVARAGYRTGKISNPTA